MNMSMDIRERIGQQLMIGVSGTHVTPEMLKLFRETYAGGLIVYRPNFASAADFKKLILDLEAGLGRKLLVAVDHEGGRVIHLAEGITVFPDNLALGQTGNETYARAQGEIEASELRRLGIDLNLAPTVDVLTETFSPNIGIRSYGMNPDLVARLGAARIEGMQSKGLSACAKHFPGLGHAPLDPHLDLPVLSTTWDDMKKVHIRPFARAIQAGVDAIMSSHAVYPFLDPEKVPATFSARIIRDYLRKEMGFSGVILSDDLEMGALKNICYIGEAACRAVEAGHDMVLICHEAANVREVFDCLCRAYGNGRLNRRELEKSVERIEGLKNKRRERFASGKTVPEPQGQILAQQIAREAIGGIASSPSLVHAPRNDSASSLRAKRSNLALNETRISVIFPRLSDLSDKIFIESECLDEKKFVTAMLDQQGIDVEGISIVGLDPTEKEIEAALDLARKSAFAVFFCFDAHLYSRSRQLLERVQRQARNFAVIFMRDPYDVEYAGPDTLRLASFGFRACQLQAAAAAVFKVTAHSSDKYSLNR